MKKCLVFLLLFAGVLCSCKTDSPISSTQYMMDTVITITLYDGDESVLKDAVSLCKQYEQLFSRTISGSDIERINLSKGEVVEVDDSTADLLKTAAQISRDSDGAFDVTILPLTELWNIKNAESIPNSNYIAEALKKVDYRNIAVDGNLVTALNGASVDLGGIAKGYIADRVCEFLKSKGVTNAIINLGGNVVVLGNKDGNGYSVGIQKPFAPHGELSATLMISNKTAVTSGIYERYINVDNKIYHHVIDTKTGYPTDNGLQSVTVIADSSAIADGLSTACLSLGVEEGKKLIEKYSLEAVFISADGSMTLTDGLVKSETADGTIIKIAK